MENNVIAWKKKVKSWMYGIRYDHSYKMKAEAVEKAKEVAKEINDEQDMFIIGIEGGVVKKRDNTSNSDNYFQTTIPRWDVNTSRWTDIPAQIKQRHQLARTMFRKDPKYGKRLMEKVVYSIPNIEKWQDEYDEIMNYEL